MTSLKKSAIFLYFSRLLICVLRVEGEETRKETSFLHGCLHSLQLRGLFVTLQPQS